MLMLNQSQKKPGIIILKLCCVSIFRLIVSMVDGNKYLTCPIAYSTMITPSLILVLMAHSLHGNHNSIAKMFFICCFLIKPSDKSLTSVVGGTDTSKVGLTGEHTSCCVKAGQTCTRVGSTLPDVMNRLNHPVTPLLQLYHLSADLQPTNAACESHVGSNVFGNSIRKFEGCI